MTQAATPDAAPRPTEGLYDQLKLMAMTFQMRPGERINEIELAGRLNVSRTPLREALNRLVSEGFLTTLPGRGFFGRPLDVKQVFDLYEFRCSLEQTIVRLVCARATDAELDALEQFAASRPAHDEGKSLAALQHDEAFHLHMARLTGNAEFERCLAGVSSRIHFVRWIDLRQSGPMDGQAHRHMVHLLRQRDAEACAAHIGGTIRRRYEEIDQAIRAGLAEIYMRPNTTGP